MEQAARDIEFDTKKTPLGKISADQIKLGYASLSQIADLLKQSNTASVSKSRKIPTNNRRKLTETDIFAEKKSLAIHESSVFFDDRKCLIYCKNFLCGRDRDR